MRRSLHVSALFIIAVAIAAEPAAGQSLVAGSIVGEFNTDARGAASYTISLPAPPGTGGIEPDLTLSYNSSGGNGLLGMGWTLAGMSSIARCPPTFAADGYRAPIAYTIRDRLCLDGMELVAVSGGYWAPGAVYHTQLESWTQVTAQADGSFVARTAEGKTAIYGGDAQSRIVAPAAGQTRVWAMSSVADRFGNTMTFSYANNPGGSGQYYPTAIDYTSNAASPLRYARRVRFDYDFSRVDAVTRYAGGSPIRLGARLTGIRTFLVNPSETPVASIKLSYQYSATTSRSLLASVQQCDAQSSCYPATAFTPQVGSNTLRAPQQIGQPVFGTTNNVKFAWGSFRGNGRKDLLAYNNGPPNNAWVATLSADGMLDPNPIDLGPNPCAGNAYQWQDFDGDGKIDLLCTPNTGDLRHWVRLSTGTGLAAPIVLGTIQCIGGDFTWADFNGDGRPDLICNAPTARSVRLSAGNALGTFIPLPTFAPANSTSTWADFNGDGMADLLVDQSAAPFNHWVLISNGNGVSSPVSLGTLGDANSAFAWVDLNGDGLADLVADGNVSPFQHWVRFSTGTALTPNPTLLGQFPPAAPSGTRLDYRWVDFNGDGLADLVCCDVLAATTGRYVLISNGTALATPVPITNFARSGATYDWQDLDGDGMADLAVSPDSYQGQAFAARHQGPFPDLVAMIQDGLGGQTRIAYQPMGAPSVYSPDPGFRFAYPLRELVAPIYVVQRKNTNDGRLNIYTYDYTYRYQGSVSDLSGRGWLGFARIEASDGQTSVVRRTEYALPFPLTGMVTGQQTLSNANLLLEQKTFTYASSAPYPGVSSVQGTGQTLSYHDGGNQYTTAKSFAYDAYGSVTLTTLRGDVANPADDYQVCASYLNRTTGSEWLIGFPTMRTTAKSCTVRSDGSCDCSGALSRVSYAYSAQGPVTMTSMASWVDTGDSVLEVDYTYDAYGNPATISSPATGIVTVKMDPDYATFEVQRTNALGQEMATTFAPAFGVQLSSTDPNGVVRKQEIDGFGRPVSIAVPDPSGRMQTVREIRRVLEGSLSAGGHIYTETRSLNDWGGSGGDAWRWSRQYLDGLGRTYLTRAGAGTDETHTIDRATRFDNEAQVQTDSLSYYQGADPPWVQYAYDMMGRVSRTQYANGSVTAFDRAIVPDPGGSGAMVNRVHSVSAAGTQSARSLTRYIDAQGNLVRNVYADNAVAAFGYDLLNRPVRVDLPNGTTSTVAYDSAGRRTRATSSDSGTNTFVYDASGRLERQTNGAGASIAYTYDAIGRTTLARLSTGQSVAYTYDEAGHGFGIGRLTTRTVSGTSGITSTTSYSYDALGHVAGKTVRIGSRSWTESNTFDPSGRARTVTFPDSTVATTTYSPIGFVSMLAYGAANAAPLYSATYSGYTALGKPGAISYASGTTALFSAKATYFNDGRAQSQAFASASGPLAANSYTWTPLRQVDSITDSISGRTAWRYTYGPQGYLTGAQGPLAPLSFSYAYDLGGNMTTANDIELEYQGQRVVAGKSSRGPIAATYSGAGQLATFTEGGDTSRYAYDSLGKLRQFDGDGASVQFDYDGEGVRIAKSEPGVTTWYPFGDVDVTAMADGRTLLTKYLRGPFGAAIAITEGPAAPGTTAPGGGLQPGPNGWGVPAPGAYFFLRTFDGSTAMVGDGTGRIATVLGYDPYGNLQTATSSGVDETRSKFLGEELDHSTGLYALPKRYLNPRLARFITPDSRVSGGPDFTMAAFNRYAYGGNDPVNNQDPSGGFFLIDDLIELAVVAEVAADAAAEAATAAASAEAAAASASAAETAATVATVTAGTYLGGAAVNGSLNPGKWKWGSPVTFVGLLTGGVFGAFGGDIASGISDALGGGFTGGLVGQAAESGIENAVYAVESHPDPANIAESFFLGAVQGAAFHALGEGVAASFAKRESRLMKPDEIEMQDLSVARVRSASRDIGTPKVEAPAGSAGGSCSLSLAAGTEVLTDRGPLPVERVTLGDRVLAMDEAKGSPSSFMVVGTGARTAPATVRLGFGAAQIVASLEHPFYVEGRGWVEAQSIAKGDRLRRLEGDAVTVDSLERMETPTRVHSLQVDRAAHFAATPQAVLAHNITYNMAQCVWGVGGRVEQIDVDVAPADIGTGSATSQATRNFARAMGLPNDDAGHVIARMLGGSGTNTNNIFPQNLSVNRGTFARWERVIRRDIQAQNQVANLRVQFHYTAGATRPYQIDYEYTLLGITTSNTFGNP